MSLRRVETLTKIVGTCVPFVLVLTGSTGGPAIISTSHIKVLLDPPPPFSYLPQAVLEATGNAVMSASLAVLQTTFIDNLAKNYDLWATNPVYRKDRNPEG